MPWVKFYVTDWRGDEAVQEMPLRGRGAWIETLCLMWRKQTHQISKTVPDWAKLWRCSQEEALAALDDFAGQQVCEMTGLSQACDGGRDAWCDTLVTVTCRRLEKEHNRREATRLRTQQWRKGKHGDAAVMPDVTPKKRVGDASGDAPCDGQSIRILEAQSLRNSENQKPETPELLSSSKTPKKARKRPPMKTKAPSEHRSFIEWWTAKYLELRGVAYVFGGGKDATAVKAILSKLGLAEAQTRGERYLRDDDEFVQKQGHTLAFFQSRLNAYAKEHRTADAKKYRRGGAALGMENPFLEDGK